MGLNALANGVDPGLIYHENACFYVRYLFN